MNNKTLKTIYTASAICLLVALFMVLIPIPVFAPVRFMEINKTALTLTAYEADGVRFEVPITSGGVLSPTRNGQFQALSKIENVPSYHGYNFPLWLGVYEVGPYENGIHSVEGENPWTEKVGIENSTPGSIILDQKDMEKVYEWARIDTIIYIYN